MPKLFQSWMLGASVIPIASYHIENKPRNRYRERLEVCAMFDVETYLITKETLSAPIIRQVEPQLSHGYDANDDGNEPSLGTEIGQAISLLLILGTLLYFYLAR